MLLDSHPYIGWYCYTYKLIRNKPADEQQEVRIRLYVDLQHDQWTYSLSTAEEIAVIIPEKEVHHTWQRCDVTGKRRTTWVNKPEQSFIWCSLLCSNISKGREWIVSKNSNPWCSTKRTREEWKTKRWKAAGSLTGGLWYILLYLLLLSSCQR